jgi:hypothetical protein
MVTQYNNQSAAEQNLATMVNSVGATDATKIGCSLIINSI